MAHLAPATKSDARFPADLEAEVMRPSLGSKSVRDFSLRSGADAGDLPRIIRKADCPVSYVSVEQNADHLQLGKLCLAPGAQDIGIGASVPGIARDDVEAAAAPLRLSVPVQNQRALVFCLRQGLQVSDNTAQRGPANRARPAGRLRHIFRAPLAPRATPAYILPCPGLASDYGDKRTCNKRLGPGGGTRRLHHSTRHCGGKGPKQDRRTSKEASFYPVGTTVIGPQV